MYGHEETLFSNSTRERFGLRFMVWVWIYAFFYKHSFSLCHEISGLGRAIDLRDFYANNRGRPKGMLTWFLHSFGGNGNLK